MITKESLRKQVQVAIRKAVTLTSQGQSAQGGWTYIPGTGDEGSVTVTQVQALRAAHNAGFLVPRAVIEESVKYLENCRTARRGDPVLAPLRRRTEAAISAAAVATLYNAGQFDSTIATDCLKYVWDQFRPTKDGTKGAATTFTRTSTPRKDSTWRATSTGTRTFPAPATSCSRCRARWVVERRWDRRGLRHRDRRHHPAASVQVSADFPAR